MRTTSTIKAGNGLTYYYEQEGSGPDIVLVPDGLGECHFFNKGIPHIAAAGFRVTTFDMPGMSRSSDNPAEVYTNVTGQKLASYVIALLDALNIPVATFWGCSSGGSTVLALCKDYPDRVRNALAHEVPDTMMDHLLWLVNEDDETIRKSLMAGEAAMAGNNETAWNDLGEEVLARVRQNYTRWARGYPMTIPPSSPTSQADLHEISKRPLVWSVGETTPMSMFYTNVVAATKAGIELKLLPGGHLVYVSHPEVFAKHIVEATRKYV